MKLIHSLIQLVRIARMSATMNAEGATGTHKHLSLLADAALGSTHLLLKAGTDASHVAVCGAANYPLGSTNDQPEAAEDLLNVFPLGAADHTRKLRCASALGADIDLFTAASGLVQGLPGVAGTYYKVGRSIGAAVQVGSSDYIIEVATCEPKKLTVIATATGTAATDIAALFTALQGTPDIVRAL